MSWPCPWENTRYKIEPRECEAASATTMGKTFKATAACSWLLLLLSTLLRPSACMLLIFIWNRPQLTQHVPNLLQNYWRYKRIAASATQASTTITIYKASAKLQPVLQPPYKSPAIITHSAKHLQFHLAMWHNQPRMDLLKCTRQPAQVVAYNLTVVS